jgi:hypothetical protein
MSNAMMGRLKLAAVCTVLGLASACSTVTPEQLSAVDAKATSAQADARTAATNAANALKAAQAAQEAAAAAQAAADAAMACCNENKDRLDKMLEKTMQK